MANFIKAIAEGFSAGILGAALNYNKNDRYGGQKIGGLYIDGVVLPGRNVQCTHEESSTQNYELGERRVTKDGRVFRYAYIGSTVCYASAGVKPYDNQFCGWTAVNAAQVAGDSQISLASKTAAIDVLKGGYIMMADSGDTRRQHRQITGNTYASGSTLIIYLDEPLDYAMTDASSVVEVLYNPYRNCYWMNEGNSSIIGIPAMNSSVGKYIWLQTWGILTLSPGSATPDPGQDAEEREVIFDAAGNILCYGDGSGADRQTCGFIIQKDDSGAGCPFIMLQISP